MKKVSKVDSLRETIRASSGKYEFRCTIKKVFMLFICLIEMLHFIRQLLHFIAITWCPTINISRGIS